MKVVMEKSWNMKNWPKVMEFLFQILPLNCTKLVLFLAATKKLCIDLFFCKTLQIKFKIERKDGHGKLMEKCQLIETRGLDPHLTATINKI